MKSNYIFGIGTYWTDGYKEIDGIKVINAGFTPENKLRRAYFLLQEHIVKIMAVIAILGILSIPIKYFLFN